MIQFNTPGPHGPKGYRFKVDGQHFESKNQFVSGLELRQLAGLTAETELYVDVPHGWQDHFVSCDDQVDLGNPGTEKFVTLRKKTVIFVNGTPYEYKKEKVTYEYDKKFIKKTSKYRNKKDYEKAVKKELKEQKQEEADEQLKEDLWARVLEKTEINK